METQCPRCEFIHDVQPDDHPDDLGAAVLDRLNLGEREILRMVLMGLPNQTIATRLNTTEQVVKNRLSRILSKSQTCNRTQLAVFAMRHRMVTL
jgi:DNA-binding NarL/FixJ family response regulator